MKVFVTGATGLVGSFVIKQLLHDEHEVVALRRPGNPLKMAEDFAHDLEWVEGDLEDVALLTQAMEKCEAVVHAAALVSFDPADHNLIMRVNLQGTTNMVNAALAQHKKPVFCLVSSVAALAMKSGKNELNETALGDAETQFSPYGKSKFLAELELFRAEAEGLPVFAVNPSMVLGPGYEGEGSTALISYATKRQFFTPSGIMNYVDVRDLVQIVVSLLGKPEAIGKRYVVSAGHIFYNDFFAKVAQLSGTKPPSIVAGKWLSAIGWRVAAIASLFTRHKPMLTRQTAQSGRRKVIYSSINLPQILPDFAYKSLDETLKWAVPRLRKRA
jgi:nucleoside-diphosphate-sugar epimerase